MTVPQHVFLAARTGDITVLREYFASGGRDPNDVAWTGWTLLDGACRGTRDEVAGRDWGGTPRVISCEVVSFLLSQGASCEDERRKAAHQRRKNSTRCEEKPVPSLKSAPKYDTGGR